MFIKKLNWNEDGHLIQDEEIDLTSSRNHKLNHHNLVFEGGVVVYTGKNKTGTMVDGFSIVEDFDKPFQHVLMFDEDVASGIYYATYYSQGDENDADDINDLQDAILSVISDMENIGSGSSLEIRDIIPNEQFTVTNAPPVANPPVLTSSVDSIDVDDKTPISIVYNIENEGTGQLTATYTVNQSSTTTNVNKGQNTWEVGLLTEGVYDLKLKVKNKENLESNTLSFTVTVTAQLEDVNVTGVTLNTNTATVMEGKTIILKETVSPINATDKSVTWSSDDELILTVNNSGVVTGVDLGNATVTVATNDGGFTDSCSVEVVEFVLEEQTFEDNGYLHFPIDLLPVREVVSYSDENYIAISPVANTSVLFDMDANEFIKFSTLEYYSDIRQGGECYTITSDKKYMVRIHRDNLVGGEEVDPIEEAFEYLKTIEPKVAMKLSSNYKMFTITPNISNVTTRTSGVKEGFEYFKCNLLDAPEYPIPPQGKGTDPFYSIGYPTTAYVFSASTPSIKIVGTELEILLTEGTIGEINLVNVSQYLSEQNIKVYYVTEEVL